MRKIAHRVREQELQYSGARLYRDDIEFLKSLLEQDNFVVSISDGQFEFDSIDEFIEHRGATPIAFELRAVQGEDLEKERVTLTTRRGIAYSLYLSWSAWEVENSHQATWYAVREYVQAKTLSFRRAVNPAGWLLVALGFAFIALLALDKLYAGAASKHLEVLIPVLAVSLIPLIGSIASSAYSRNYRPVVLRRKHEGGFFRRNQEQLALRVIDGLIGAVFGFLAGFLVRGS